MGNCHSSGAQLLALVQCGQTSAAKEVLEQHPVAACYSTYVERNSPLLVAAGRGHYRLVQAIVEAAVIAQGAAKAKQRCINHTNNKGHSALILACMNGHAQCVESLVCNGASPLVLDNSRHNTALHWAASACRSECVQRLLGSAATFQMQSGEVVRIADIPCFDEDNSTLVKFVDRHNGWGLTALHIAVFKGSTSTVRALLRNGASISCATVAPSFSSCPVNQPAGSTPLHMAAAADDIGMARLLLEAQASSPQAVPDLRRAVNASAADARWAEQEHALLLMRSILQTIFSALQAAQQALSAAASRAALRQRQQEQLAALLGSERPLAGLSSGRRVALGSHHEQGSRIHFGSSGAGSSSTHRRSNREPAAGRSGGCCSSRSGTTGGATEAGGRVACWAKGVPLCPFCRQPIAGFAAATDAAAG
ncbi:hypothetical protein OEZ86_004106 [Tetradesmus obliquus]|nr:hypothetical protein OEZ86_004106 [Tetradesmus obliquus]